MKFSKYFHNIAWIVGDKSLSIIVGFAITVLVAKYLGPENFGVLAYAISLTALFASLTHLGLAGLVVKEIVIEPATSEKLTILGTAFGLKFAAASLSYMAMTGYAAVYDGVQSQEFRIIAIVGLALLFQPLLVIESWFEAHLQAKFVTVPRVVALFSVSILRLVMVLGGASLFYFAVAHLLQFVLTSILLVAAFWMTSGNGIRLGSFSRRTARELLSRGWIIYISSIFAAMYLKADQVMLKWLSGAESVGTYALAAQISEAWYFVPAAIVATFFPRLIEVKGHSEDAFNGKLQQLFDVLFILGFVVAIFVSLTADWLVGTLLGAAYKASAHILVIHIWTAIFIFMRAAFSKWIIIQDLLVISLLTQGAGAVSNIFLNLCLIPSYGGEGAAFATLISYSIASFFSLALYSKTRPIFWQMCRATLSPLRFIPRINSSGTGI